MSDAWHVVESRVDKVSEAAARKAAAPSLLRRGWPALLILLLATGLVVGGVFDWLRMDALQREYAQLLDWATQRPMATGIALAVALTLLVSSGLPGGVVLLIAAGALFGTVAGAAIGLFGNVVGGTVLYTTARRLFLGHAKTPPQWVERFRSGFDRAPVAFALFLRLVPVFPFGAASVALAWLGCRPAQFVATSAVGILPALFVYSALGSGLSLLLASGAPVDADALAQPRVWLPLAALGTLALVAATVGFLRGRGAG